MSTKPRAHATKWTVVVGLDRTTVRLFADHAKAETERDFHVQHGRQAYLLPPVAAGGTPITVHATFAHVHDQLKAPAWASWPSRWTLKRTTASTPSYSTGQTRSPQIAQAVGYSQHRIGHALIFIEVHHANDAEPLVLCNTH
jgi:hypothetical protein